MRDPRTALLVTLALLWLLAYGLLVGSDVHHQHSSAMPYHWSAGA